MIIDELIALLGYRIEGEDKLKRFTGGIDAAEGKLRKASAAMNTMQVAVGSFIGSLATAGFMKLADTIGSIPGDVIKVSAQFEGFQTSLETIEGSSEKAKASMDWIAQFAAKTPYELAGITDAFIKLKARGFDPMDGTLSTLGDTASAMNKTLDQAVEAFTDAATNQFERLKEFGITSSQKGDEVTFSWQQNGKQMQKTVKKTGGEVTKFLKEVFGTRFNGAMIRQSKTWNGMLSNLSDSWNLFMKRIGDKGIFERVKGMLGGFLDYVGKLDADGTLDRWAQNISDGMVKTVEEVIGMGERLKRHWDFINQWVSLNPDWVKPIMIGLGILAAFKFPRMFALLVLEDALNALEGKASVIGDIAKYLSELTGIDSDTLTKVLTAVAVFGAGAMLWGGSFGIVAAGIRGLAAALAMLGAGGAAKGLGTLGSLATLAGRLSPYLAMFGLLSGGGKLNEDGTKQSDEDYNKKLNDQLAQMRKGNHVSQIMARRKEMESWLTPPTKGNIDDNTPGIKNLFDNINNFNNNAAKTGAQAPVINNDNSNKSITTNTTVNLEVQRLEQAADAAASAVRSAVASKATAASSAVAPKARTQMGHF